ncbi:MAG: EVE domain-containing protein [Planctomycetes bacterium]|nr:EVE domain-containing protein [Planctomycetota bacterium]
MAARKTPPKAAATTRGRRYWLFKSEPDTYSFEQFQRDRRTNWNGVRNYQARNLLRDEIAVGDGVLFYHSSTEPMAVVGVARVIAAGYPDATAFDPASPYHDPDSDPDEPTWFQVDIECVAPLRSAVTREQCKAVPALRNMVLLQKGSRLSVQPVATDEWRAILELGGNKETW